MEVLASSSDPARLSICRCRNPRSTIHMGNSHKYRNRLGEPAMVRLRKNRSRTLTVNMLAHHRPSSSTFPHAGPAHSISFPRRLQPQLRAPSTHTAVGGRKGGLAGWEGTPGTARREGTERSSFVSLLQARRSLRRLRRGIQALFLQHSKAFFQPSQGADCLLGTHSIPSPSVSAASVHRFGREATLRLVNTSVITV